MLMPMLIALAGSAAAELADLPPEVSAFTDDASGWLLEGHELPRDYRMRLLQMPPEERLQAIVFLRRSGLLTGTAWTLDDVLRPALKSGEVSE